MDIMLWSNVIIEILSNGVPLCQLDNYDWKGSLVSKVFTFSIFYAKNTNSQQKNIFLDITKIAYTHHDPLYAAVQSTVKHSYPWCWN